jgi:hypothetical protein
LQICADDKHLYKGISEGNRRARPYLTDELALLRESRLDLRQVDIGTLLVFFFFFFVVRRVRGFRFSSFAPSLKIMLIF